MGSKKRHINNEVELLKAMRITGYNFPINDNEQRISLKMKSEINLAEISDTIDPEEIWNAEAPKPYKAKGIIKELISDDDISKEWGMAARGNANISKETMDKIKKNQAGDKSNG